MPTPSDSANSPTAGPNALRNLRSKNILPVLLSLLLFAAAVALLTVNRSPVLAENQPNKPLAIAGGQSFYEKDLLPEFANDLYKLQVQEYELKRDALLAAINKRLLQKEAAARGIAPEELVRQEVDSKVLEPAREEIEQAFVEQMFQGGAQASEDDFVKQYKQDRLQQARENYYSTLREKAGVKILLLPPARNVAYDRSRVRGNPDAKITMVEFSDFQCPYCLQAYSTVKHLLAKYNGKVKLAYRDLPPQEVQSGAMGAGEAARCAGEQGKFWEYHDLLFENQDEYGEEAFNNFAEGLKLDGKKFSACLDSRKYKEPVKQDFQEAMRLGITGTPAFFINGVFVNGARPQAEFEQIIEAELATMDRN